MARAPAKSSLQRNTRLDAEAWISAGLEALAQGGLEAVRVEPLAKALSVTKGSFYWHFADRRALIEAVLAHWRDGRVAAIRQQADGTEDPATILQRLADLYTRSANYRGLAIELTIRALARHDAVAARAIAKVDAERLGRVAKLFCGLGWPAAEAQARAVLFYSYLFGQALLDAGTATPPMRKSAVASLIAPIPERLSQAKP